MKLFSVVSILLLSNIATVSTATPKQHNDKKQDLSSSVSRNLRSRELQEQTCFDCASKNPCSPTLHTEDLYYYNHCNNDDMFVQCSQWGQCYVQSCPVGLMWNQTALTCDYPEVEGEESTACFSCEDENPCNSLNTAGKYYYAHCDIFKYVQCSAHGQCWDHNCPNNTQWDDALLGCVHSS